MRLISFLAICFLASGCKPKPPITPAPPAKPAPMGISIEDLNTGKVLGQLGVPLGTIVRVNCRGIVPTSDDLDFKKGRSWTEEIEILSIDGRAFDPPLRLSWGNHPGTGPEKPAQGETREIYGYETGMFTGIPDGFSKYGSSWQDAGFRFENSFVPVVNASEHDAKKGP